MHPVWFIILCFEHPPFLSDLFFPSEPSHSGDQFIHYAARRICPQRFFLQKIVSGVLERVSHRQVLSGVRVAMFRFKNCKHNAVESAFVSAARRGTCRFASAKLEKRRHGAAFR